MRISGILFICLALISCSKSDNKNSLSPHYFDLKSFFQKEGLRLNTINLPVLKTVSRNGTSETRKLHVNWINELSLFTESDINKPAWNNSYRKTSGLNSIEYTALEDKLRTRKIKINTIKNQIKSIHIINRVTNFLYQSKEELIYYPDSVYIIKKNQSVKILGINQFMVTGKRT